MLDFYNCKVADKIWQIMYNTNKHIIERVKDERINRKRSKNYNGTTWF